MTLVLAFPSGVRVTSSEDGSVIAEYGDQPLEIVGGRLVPLRCGKTRYAIQKARWIRRQLERHPGLSPSQQATGRRIKRDLARQRA